MLVSSCASTPPQNVDNVCSIFREKKGWYDDAADASKKWGVPINVLMAIVHQESKFNANIKPKRRKILGIIPGTRPSSAFGYPQALDETWDYYVSKSGNNGAERDDFEDSMDFVGWYSSVSHKRNHIKRDDAYHLYLAYHEGHGGFEKRTFNKKSWLKAVSKKVSAKSIAYRRQLNGCEKEFQNNGWWFF